MNIGFTGHRNKYADPKVLREIASQYPDAIWIHGNAIGFDTQVKMIAKDMGIHDLPVEPSYRFKGDREAPLIRNEKIVNAVDIVYALYDGRYRGGTLQTINYAKKVGKPVIILEPYEKRKTD